MIKITNYLDATSKEQLNKSFKIKDLKSFLRNAGCKVSGNKPVLIERLYTFIIKKRETDKLNIKPILLNVFEFYKNYKKDKQYNLNDIEFTLDHHKIKKNGLIGKKYKGSPLKMLCSFSRRMIKHKKKSIRPIIKIQCCYRRYLKQKLLNFSKYSIKDCVNDEDFLTYDDLEDIPKEYLFIYKDTDNLIYGFDIRSLLKFVLDSKKYFNPYNNVKFSKNIQKKIFDFYNLIKLNDDKFDQKIVEKKNFKNEYYKIREEALEVFQIMNVELNNYVDVNWFLNLNRVQLKKLYRNAEDIWNYRIQHLTNQTRKKHIKNNDAFKMSVLQFYKLININKMRKIIINEFRKFVTEGETIEECKTGAMWMLTALVEVSKEACNAMPWLLQ